MIDPNHARARRDDFSIPPAAFEPDDDERDYLLAERRRRLGRWVVLTVGASIVVCVAAVVRVVRDRDAAASEVVLALPAAASLPPTSAPPLSPPPSAAPAPTDSSPAPKSKGAGAEKEARHALEKCAKRSKRGAHGECLR